MILNYVFMLDFTHVVDFLQNRPILFPMVFLLLGDRLILVQV